MKDGLQLPGYEDVVAAAQRLSGQAVRTPLVHSPGLSEHLGGDIFLKPEILQVTGSFKFRGAYNALSKLDADQKARGVVAFSSGNHGQGVAEAARRLGIHARIVMPADAPAVKAEGVRARGAEVISYDREREDREEIAGRLASESGAAIIPSFDHPDIIAGQGTCGLEIFQDLAADGISADQLICCVGGGGLIGGINLAAAHHSPDTRIFGAEPEGFDDHARSLAAGERLSNTRKSGSIQDALLSGAPGRLTFAINRRLSGVGVVSDDEALDAVAFGLRVLKLVVEPGGAAALAAALSGKIDCRGKTTVIVLTGGNIDPQTLAQAALRPGRT